MISRLKKIPGVERRTSAGENNRNKNNEIEVEEDFADGSNSSENNQLFPYRLFPLWFCMSFPSNIQGVKAPP